MRNEFKKYDKLSYRTILWKLRGEGLPEDIIAKTIDGIKEFRKARTKERASRKEAEKQWGEIILALQHERKIVRSMVRYKPKNPAPEREEFITHYFEVLTKVYERLNTKRQQSAGLPEHDHWTDYVPHHIKAALMDAAINIPHRDKAKIKTPFERTIPFALFDLRKGRLQRSTRAQLQTVLERQVQEPDNAQLKVKEARIREALVKISALEMGQHVPNTWHGLVEKDSGVGIADHNPDAGQNSVR